MLSKPLASASPLLLPLVLVAAGVLSVAPPAVAQGILALDPPIILPGASQGHSPAQVALRDDGGLVTLWVDVPSYGSSGRWLGPPSGEVGGTFQLMPDGSIATLRAMARATDGSDRHLAVWRRSFGSASPQGLAVRPFDGEGRPLGPAVVAVDSPVGDAALAPRPGGGWVLAWWGPTSDSQALHLRFLDPLGNPGGPVLVAVDTMDLVVSTIGLAVAPSGRFLVTWGIRTGADEVTILGRGYGASGESLSEAIPLVGPMPLAGFPAHDLAAVPGPVDRFLLAWVERESASPAAPGAVLARPFDLLGQAQGSARRLDIASDERWPGQLSVATGADGDGVVAWIETGPDLEQRVDERIVARLVDDVGAPRSEVFLVLGRLDAAVALGNDGATGGISGVDAARDASGFLAFGWGIYRDSQVIPTDLDLNLTNGARRFREILEDCAPVLTVDLRTDPAPPVEGEPVTLVIDGVANCAEVVLDAVTQSGGTIQIAATAESQACGTFPPFPYELVAPVGPFDEGPRTVELEIALPQSGVCARSFDFEVVPREEVPPPDDPPPPSRAPLTSPQLSGFRVWVEITPQGQAPLAGTRVTDCLPEVLCVAGALSGRAEVFVRVIGPRPNGFLWPVLVQLTPSEVEVWIEQTATGEVRYYRLDAADPDGGELDGLFDRTGFVPR